MDRWLFTWVLRKNTFQNRDIGVSGLHSKCGCILSFIFIFSQMQIYVSLSFINHANAC